MTDPRIFTQADKAIWAKIQEYKVIDEIFSMLSTVPKWARLKFIGDKANPRATSYASPEMTDEQAIEQGFSLNPQWADVRLKMIPIVVKYQISRSAGVLADGREPPLAIVSPEEQAVVEEETRAEVVQLAEKRDKAAAEQAAALKRVQQKRSG